MAADEGGMGGNEKWSEAVEDLVENGNVDGAISLLESVVSYLENLVSSSTEPDTRLQIATALGELADLYSSKGLSLKADDLRSHSLLIRARVLHTEPRRPGQSGSFGEKDVLRQEIGNEPSSKQCQEEEEDWETIADIDTSLAEFSLSAQPEKRAVLDPSNVTEPSSSPKRRGRGSFLFKKNELYSDQLDQEPFVDEDVDACSNPLQDDAGTGKTQRYGTGHVILLYDFPPTTRTAQLENLLSTFRDGGFAIRWVSDSVALAVFRTPYAAHEAQSSVAFPFKTRILEEEDMGMLNISPKDLEPPLVRPKTSVRTAQRLISHAIGIHKDMGGGGSSSSSRAGWSDEFRRQEAERKKRILERQNMMHDAWGPP